MKTNLNKYNSKGLIRRVHGGVKRKGVKETSD